jgi:glutamine cyclotransferase
MDTGVQVEPAQCIMKQGYRILVSKDPDELVLHTTVVLSMSQQWCIDVGELEIVRHTKWLSSQIATFDRRSH